MGKRFDVFKNERTDQLVLYDSKDLVTHAVCVGMTGSGKTGLCMAILEEAAIDGVPSIVIDPKGDMVNLMLTFPDLRAEDFVQWVSEEEATKKGLTKQQFAEAKSSLWKKGLADWNQSGERIRKMRDSTDFVVYTPGSNAGIPVSIISSFSAPSSAIITDEELMQERISATVSSLLGLLGIQSDPLSGREHLLLATIFNNSWKAGRDLDLALLIQLVQNPGVSKIGVLDLETFYPAKDRFGLVMSLNGLLASPTFSSWSTGQPLEIDSILHTPTGKPRVAIFYIAHLSDAERMFFVSTLLNQMVSWMRTQPGTGSLRTILYMDEIYGYFPPVANPPSKKPMLTLLKQARAFGLGILLATQNPVDLDYRGLANTGTWFVGRLQTERDKARLLDGLEGAATTSGSAFDRNSMDRMISGLSQRVFLLNNTHESEPELFQTRWVMSYMAGPMTREQIRILMEEKKENVQRPVSVTPSIGAPDHIDTRPSLPPDILQYFMPVVSNEPDRQLVYKPGVIGGARITFSDRRYKIDLSKDVTTVTWLTDSAIAADWKNSSSLSLSPSSLEKSPVEPAKYLDLPAEAANGKRYASWEKDYVDWITGDQSLTLLKSPGTGINSSPDEGERDFRVRLHQAYRELRDVEVEKIRKKYSQRVATLQDRIRRAEQAVDRKREQASAQKRQAALSVGTAILAGFMGRKRVSMSSLSRASRAAQGMGRSRDIRRDVERAAENVDVLNEQLYNLEQELRNEISALESRIDPLKEVFETIKVRPARTGISVTLFGLAWAPFWKKDDGSLVPAWGKQ